MKKYLYILLILSLVLALPCRVIEAADGPEITVTVDGSPVSFPDQAPTMVQDRVLVPARGVFEAMGASLTYLPEQNGRETVQVTRDQTVITFVIGSREATVVQDGVSRSETLEVPAQLMRDRTMIPLRFLSENLGYTVVWQDAENRAVISTPPTEFAAPSSLPFSPELIQPDSRVDLGDAGGLAVARDGSVWSWNNPADTPAKVSGISGAVAVACGGSSMYALCCDGSLWSWGGNAHGQLGRDAENADSQPGRVSGLPKITAVSAGQDFVLALDEQGRVWSWGGNRFGQLGLGDTQNRTQPQQVTGISGKAVSIAAGSGHSAAVTSAQEIWLWGSNSEGQLARPQSTRRCETPFRLKSVTRIVKAAAGGGQTLALRPDGSVYMWGTTYIGQPPEPSEETPEEEQEDTPENPDKTPQEPSEETGQNPADADGFYRYPEPQRIRRVYHNWEKDRDEAAILVGASMISCGTNHSMALSEGKLYVWGDSVLMPYRLRDQIWRFNAQEYIGLDQLQGVYAAPERSFYALDRFGSLWLVDQDGKRQILNLE